MTKEEVRQGLLNLGFTHNIYNEYHRVVMTKKYLVFVENRLDLEVYLDYYNVRILWWYETGKKVSKSFYLNGEISSLSNIEELLSTFVGYCVGTYGIDLSKCKQNG